jgi:hypothetical protein
MLKNKIDVHYRVVKIQAGVSAFVGAVVGAFIIFFATTFLLIKGGDNIGQHLSLLGQYFPGYSVTWIGSFFGLFYGVLVGGIFGWLIGFIYNFIVDLKNKKNDQ